MLVFLLCFSGLKGVELCMPKREGGWLIRGLLECSGNTFRSSSNLLVVAHRKRAKLWQTKREVEGKMAQQKNKSHCYWFAGNVAFTNGPDELDGDDPE